MGDKTIRQWETNPIKGEALLGKGHQFITNIFKKRIFTFWSDKDVCKTILLIGIELLPVADTDTFTLISADLVFFLHALETADHKSCTISAQQAAACSLAR